MVKETPLRNTPFALVLPPMQRRYPLAVAQPIMGVAADCPKTRYRPPSAMAPRFLVSPAAQWSVLEYLYSSRGDTDYLIQMSDSTPFSIFLIAAALFVKKLIANPFFFAASA